MARQGSTSLGVTMQLSFRNMAGTVARIHGATDALIVPAMREAVQIAGGEVKRVVQATVPIDTQFMHDHVRDEYSADGLSFEVGWLETDFDAAGLSFYPIFVEFGTVKMRAQPSLGPAYAEVKPKFQSDVSRLVRESIERRANAGVR